MSGSVIELEALTVPGRVAGVSFSVGRGTTFALRGANGSGKSTVLDAMLGLVPFEGRCEVRTRALAVVPQRLEVPSVLPLNVRDFLALQRTQWPVALGVRRTMRSRITTLLEASGLGHIVDRQLATLSGGELRRLLLADALERAPELLLLDEPEASLDEPSRAWLDALISSLPARGVTTVLVTHDPALARLATGSHSLGGAHA